MIKPLTSLRFFFALFVFLSHLQGIKNENAIFQWFVRNIFFEGYLGVSFFFILSGFVISYSNNLRIENNQFDIINFYKARIFRIYPLYFLTMIICAIGLTKISWLTWFVNIFAIQSFLPTINDHIINAPSWSISNEFFFYLCFPLIFPLIKRSGIKKSISILLILILLLFSISFVIREDALKFVYYINPVSRLLDFTLGIILFQLFKYIESKNYPTLQRPFWEYLALIIFLFFFIPHNAIPRMFRFSIYYWIPMSSIILIFAFQKGTISKLLRQKMFVYLGEISFSFYMIHLFVINFMQSIWSNTDAISTILIILTVTIFASILLFEYFEKPINKYLKRNFLS